MNNDEFFFSLILHTVKGMYSRRASLNYSCNSLALIGKLLLASLRCRASFPGVI